MKDKEPETVYDSIKKTVFSRAGMNLSYKILLAKKNDRTNERMDSIYTSTQKKSPYNREYEIQNVSINTSDFIELSISDKTMYQSTLVSYHNIVQFKKKFASAVEMFTKAGMKENFIRDPETDELVPKFFNIADRNRVLFESGTGTIGFFPDIIELSNNQPSIPACRVIMNHDSNFVKIPVEHMRSFQAVLESMNLLQDSLTLYGTAVGLGIVE